MDSSFREQGSTTQRNLKRVWVSLTILASIFKWLAGLLMFTEEEWEDAGIYLDRPGGE
jgi:hypothetical protein